jgi:hypothetical protein
VLGIDVVAEEVRNRVPDSVDVAGPMPIEKEESRSVAVG